MADAATSSFTYFQHHAIEVAEERFERMEVKRHPRGGWTIAERSAVSSLATYSGNYNTEAEARTALSAQRLAAVKSYMSERLRNVSKPGPEEQLGLSM
jgi:hypothetical protein